MAHARLTQVQLDRFKSYRDAVIALDRLTIVTGRNSSGKSNILDAIEVLARLSGGESLAQALDGAGRERSPVRGGSRGCAPFGEDSFALGCLIDMGEDRALDYKIEVEVEPILRIRRESLIERGTRERQWFEVRHEQPGGLQVAYANGKRGKNPMVTVRDDRSVLGQLKTALIAKTKTTQDLIGRAATVSAVLANTFHLDPVPQLMRDYVSPRESRLRRNGENLAAAVMALQSADPARFGRLQDIVRTVADCDVHALDFSRTDDGLIMLALDEGRSRKTTARLMSDGLLRFIAVATALMTASTSLEVGEPDAIGLQGQGPVPGVVLAIEEIENGLHPSHAARLLEIVKEAANQVGVSVLLTTHSPALLDCLTGDLLGSVVVCHAGRISRMQELPGYAAAMAGGTLGRVVSKGELVSDEETPEADYSEFMRLIGVDA